MKLILQNQAMSPCVQLSADLAPTPREPFLEIKSQLLWALQNPIFEKKSQDEQGSAIGRER